MIAETTEDAGEEAEDDDERDELFVGAAEPIVEIVFHSCSFSVISTDTDIPILCGPHNERGPPVV